MSTVNLQNIGIDFDKNFFAISKNVESAFWIKPSGKRFNAQELESIRKSFLPLRGIIWHTNKGKGLSLKIRNYKRAFGDWQELSETIISCDTIEQKLNVSNTYSDTAWLSENMTALSQFLNRSTSANDSTLAFIPDKNEIAYKWSIYTSLIASLHMTLNDLEHISRELVDAKGIISSYIKITAQLGGIPSLIWMDADTTYGLVFFGSTNTFIPIRKSLEAYGYTVDKTANYNTIIRGLYFPIIN